MKLNKSGCFILYVEFMPFMALICQCPSLWSFSVLVFGVGVGVEAHNCIYIFCILGLYR